MKVILGCDALLMPLTGIGNYTRHIGLHLSGDESIEELLLYAHGKFFNQGLLQGDTDFETYQEIKPSFAQNLRISLSRSQLIVSLYERVIPTINKLKLNKYRQFIFHSPNFMMPDFKGKTIVTIHDLSTLRFPQFHPKARVDFVNNAIKKSCQQADLLVTDSEFIKQELIETFKLSEDRVKAVHLGADDVFRPRSIKECREILDKFKIQFKKYFLFVSTLEPRKNILNLLNAYEEYRIAYPEGHPLVIVGGAGWNDESFKGKLLDLENREWIINTGYLTENNLAELYSGARALLFPSLYEGFGLPVLEALQSRTAVLTSSNSSMAEVAANAATLVDPHSVKSIVDGIIQLHTDSELVCQLEDYGLERAKKFSWQSCGNHLKSLYNYV